MYTEMVEIISQPDSPIILAFAVTKFRRQLPLTGPQILERYCTILSRCVRGLGLSRKRCKIVTIKYNIRLINSLNQIKNRMFFTSGGYFHQSQLCQSQLSTDIKADKLAEFVVKKVEGVRAATINVLPPSNVCHDASISTTSVKFPLRKCSKWWRVIACQSSALDLQWRASAEN